MWKVDKQTNRQVERRKKAVRPEPAYYCDVGFGLQATNLSLSSRKYIRGKQKHDKKTRRRRIALYIFPPKCLRAHLSRFRGQSGQHAISVASVKYAVAKSIQNVIDAQDWSSNASTCLHWNHWTFPKLLPIFTKGLVRRAFTMILTAWNDTLAKISSNSTNGSRSFVPLLKLINNFRFYKYPARAIRRMEWPELEWPEFVFYVRWCYAGHGEHELAPWNWRLRKSKFLMASSPARYLAFQLSNQI